MKKILFIHLAKTGGSSFRRILKNNSQLNRFDCIHNGYFLRFRDGVRVERRPLIASQLAHYDVAILIVRHPLDRLLSCYRYFLGGGLNQRGKGSFPSDLESQAFLLDQAPSLLECSRHLAEISEKIPHFRPLCHWLDAIPNPVADLVVTGHQEHFEADLEYIFDLLNVKNVSTLSARHNTSPVVKLDPWCLESRQLATQFYSADFQRFGYSLSGKSSKCIVQYWDHASPPSLIAQRMNDWHVGNPNWSYQCYNRLSASTFLGEHYGDALREAFLDIRFAAMQADVFRIGYLLASGGLWIDAATTCLSPVDHWLYEDVSLLILRREHQEFPKVWNGLIYASGSRHSLLAQAWEQISKNLLARRGVSVYKNFGPRVIRDLFETGMFDRDLINGSIKVLPASDLQGRLRIGSSVSVTGADQHWSKRQETESLYFSQSSPSA